MPAFAGARDCGSPPSRASIGRCFRPTLSSTSSERVRLAELVGASAAVAATPARNEKIAALAALLARAGPDQVAPVVSWLSGELTQRQIGVGWALLHEPPAPAPAPSLTVAEVEHALGAIGELSGPGSTAARRTAVRELLARASADEQAFLVRLQVGRPLAPMLAGTAKDVAAALARTGPAAVDWKLDGARLQVHRDGGDVAIFTRTLDDVTARLPEVVSAVSALPLRAIVLDGEAIALRPDGRPEPFQVTAARFGTREARSKPLASLFFDVLHVDGEDLLDEPLARRGEALAAVVPPEHRVPRATADDAAAAERTFAEALAAGHEGVVVKALDGAYAAGRRGSAWLKVKPV